MIKLHRIGKIAFGGRIGKGHLFFFLPSPNISIWAMGGWRVCDIGFYFTQYYFTLSFAYNYDPQEYQEEEEDI